MWQACLFHATYLFNTRMHFADIWFCFHSFWKCIIHVLKNIFTKVSLYARIILIMSKYLSELIAVWMWPQSQCEAHPKSNIWGQLSWGVNRNYGEGDTGHEQHEQMNCMSYIISRPLTPAFPHLTFPRTSLRSPLVTGSGQSSLSIFSPLFDRSFSPLWLGEICLCNGACDVCQGLPQHFTSR